MSTRTALLLCLLATTVLAQIQPEVCYRFQNNLEATGEAGHNLFVPMPEKNRFEGVKVVWGNGSERKPVHTVLYKFDKNNGPDIDVTDAPKRVYTIAVLASLDSVSDVRFLDVNTLLEDRAGHDLSLVDGKLQAQKCVEGAECETYEPLQNAAAVKPITMNLYVVTRGEDNMVRVYANGKESLAFEDAGGNFELQRRIFFFQDDFWGPQSSGGVLASLRIFREVLTPDEVLQSLDEVERLLFGKSFGTSFSRHEAPKHEELSKVGDAEGAMEKTIEDYRRELAELNAQVKDLLAEKKLNKGELEALRKRIQELEDLLAAKEKELDALRTQGAEDRLKAAQEAVAAQATIAELRMAVEKQNATIAALSGKLSEKDKELGDVEGLEVSLEARAAGAEGEANGLKDKLAREEDELNGTRALDQHDKDAALAEARQNTDLQDEERVKDERLADLMEQLRRANETIEALQVSGSPDERILKYVKRVQDIVTERIASGVVDVAGGDASAAATAGAGPRLVGCSSDVLNEAHSSVVADVSEVRGRKTSPRHCADKCKGLDRGYTHVGIRYGGLVCECGKDAKVDLFADNLCSVTCGDGSQCGSEKAHVFSYYSFE